MARTHRLCAASAHLCASARDARELSRVTRVMVANQVRRSPTRRMARLAQGASDRGGVAETRERRCPFCLSDAVRQRGKVSAADGLIRVVYRCEQCERQFEYVRKAIEFGRETPPAA